LLIFDRITSLWSRTLRFLGQPETPAVPEIAFLQLPVLDEEPDGGDGRQGEQGRQDSGHRRVGEKGLGSFLGRRFKTFLHGILPEGKAQYT